MPHLPLGPSTVRRLSRRIFAAAARSRGPVMGTIYRMIFRLLLLAVLIAASPSTQAAPPTRDEAIASDHDRWAETALRQPDGPSYEFFADALPPLRYVDAPFRHYPIALSAPGAAIKGRLVSNGSAINALARQPNWRGETGVPVTFRVGNAREEFGTDLRRLEGPKYEGGYLPIVQLR